MALPYATENQLKEISKRIKNIIENKQDTLVSGTNIKTINGNSLLGSGDLATGGGGGSSIYKLTLSESQMTEFEQNQQFTLTDEQHTNLLNSEIINFVIGTEEENMNYIMSLSAGSWGNSKDGAFLLVDQEAGLVMLSFSSDNKIAIFSSRSLDRINQYISSVDNLEVSNGIRIIQEIYPNEQNISYLYLDTINNNPILHTKNTDVKNYDLGKSINLFGKHSILVPNASTDTEINLYNHFIKITGTKDTTQVIARFTIQSSNNLVVDTPEKLSTLLGNEFELGCNGIYGNYNITGLKKTADGALNIIYNNGGAENLLSTTGITLTIEDNVKNI